MRIKRYGGRVRLYAFVDQRMMYYVQYGSCTRFKCEVVSYPYFSFIMANYGNKRIPGTRHQYEFVYTPVMR